MNTPAHQLPTIRDGSTVGFRFNVSTWVAIAGGLVTVASTLIGFVIWLNTMHSDVSSLKDGQKQQGDVQKQQGATLEQIQASLREIEFRQKYGITAGMPLPPRANP